MKLLRVALTDAFLPAPWLSMAYLPGQLEAGFIGFCAGIAEKHPLGECGVRQLSGQPQYRFVGHGIETCQSFPACSVEGLDKLRMAMPQELTAMPPAKSRYST